MNPVDPLAQLHPLREPAAVPWWPPAPGWWLLSLTLLLALAVLLAWLWRHRRRNRYRVLGLRRLEELRTRFDQEGDAVQCRADINALLKSVALHAYPRGDVAPLHGARWENFLERTSGTGMSFDGSTSVHYRRDGEASGVDHLYRAAATWIQHHEAVR
jgi:hypothetical protein